MQQQQQRQKIHLKLSELCRLSRRMNLNSTFRMTNRNIITHYFDSFFLARLMMDYGENLWMNEKHFASLMNAIRAR